MAKREIWRDSPVGLIVEKDYGYIEGHRDVDGWGDI